MGTNHRGYIRGKLLAEYLRTIATRKPTAPQTLVVNGIQLSKRQMRRLYSWEVEGANVSFWTVDSILTSLELHIDLFLTWCYEERKKSPWAGGQPPTWFERGELQAEMEADKFLLEKGMIAA